MELHNREYCKITRIFVNTRRGNMKKITAIISGIIVLFCCVQGQTMVQPKLLSQRAPDYPESAKRLRMEGKVLLNALIGIDGTVKGTELAQAEFTYAGKKSELFSQADLERMDPAYKETARSLVASARESARYWKFTPAKLGGESYESTIVIPFTYKLTVLPPNSAPALPKKKK